MSVVTVDTRESKQVQSYMVGTLGPDVVEWRTLASADFVIRDKDDCQMGIERKTVRDLLGSLADKRLWSQVNRMVAAYTFPVILVEGSYTVNDNGLMIVAGRETKWHHTSMQMAMLKLQQLHNVIVLWTPNLQGTANILRVLHARGETKCLRYS